jgi:hypothetical protein
MTANIPNAFVQTDVNKKEKGKHHNEDYGSTGQNAGPNFSRNI